MLSRGITKALDRPLKPTCEDKNSEGSCNHELSAEIGS